VAQNPLGLSTFGKVSATGTFSVAETTFILGEQLKKAVNKNRLEKKIMNFIGKNLKVKALSRKRNKAFRQT
jgi:hypothetical protein